MKKALLSLIIIIALSTHANAQNDNPCTQDWGKWFTVYSFAPGVDLQVSFKYQIKGRKGGDCGQSYYRFSKPVIKKGAHIEFKFDYRKKDGTIGTETFSFVELNKVGISEDNNSNFYQGYEMVRIYDAKLVDPQRDKSVQLKTDINTAVQNYDQQYNEVNTALGKMQDVTKRNSLQTRLTNNRNSLLQYKAQAQQQLNSGDGDAMSQTLASIKQNQDDLKTIDLDIVFANKTLPIETKKTAPIKNNGMGDAMGRRAENVSPQPQSAAITNGTTTNYAQQFQQLQNNNKQTQQTINNAFDALKGQVQQAYEQKAAAREEKFQSDMKKIKDEQQQREEAQDQRIKTMDETNRQTRVDMYQILEYSDDPGLPHFNQIPGDVKQTFYITYERDYTTDVITLNTYTLNKYSDGTWMLKPDIQKKIGFTQYINNLYYFTALLGPYANKPNAVAVINKIKAKAVGIASRINTDDNFAPINKPASASASKDFWNN